MKSGLIVTLASALVLAKRARLPDKINLDERIRFGWCREANQTDTCDERLLDHARCCEFCLFLCLWQRADGVGTQTTLRSSTST